MALYRRWVWANAWSELIGLGGSLLLGFSLFTRLDDADPLVVIGGAAFGVTAGALLEGGLVGYAQGRVLARHHPQIHLKRWVWATVVGAGTAWLIGMVPSTALALIGPPEAVGSGEGPGTAVMLLLAGGMGFVLGPILSVPQALVLRQAVRQPWTWVPANAVAWSVGMVVVFAGAGTVSPEAATWEIVITVVVVCLAAGTSVGLIHGWWLVRLLAAADDDCNGRGRGAA